MAEFTDIPETDAMAESIQDMSNAVQGIQADMAALDGKVDNLSDAVRSADVADIDYSESLNQIAQLIALQDLMMLLVVVMLFVLSGLILGSIVTRWWRHG